MADDARTLAALLKHIGRGPRLAKPLDREDARWVMAELASGRARPEQVGAVLLALRMKGETAEELAGFADALADGAADALGGALGPDGLLDGAPVVDVDLHGDGRAGRPVATLAAAFVAASCGSRVLVRTTIDNPHARTALGAILDDLGLTTAPAGARVRLAAVGVAVVDLAGYAPGAARLLGLRDLLGVRTAVNTAVKLMDPLACRRTVVGIFHGPVHAHVAGAARLRGVRRAAIVQAPGGVPEVQPDRPTRASLVDADSGDDVPPVIALDGPGAGLPDQGPLPTLVDTAAHVSALRDVLERPVTGPPGLVRFVLLTAGVQLWAAGLARSPLDAVVLAAARAALFGGHAAARLAAAAG